MEKDGGGGRNSQVEETTGAKIQQHPTAKYMWEVVNVLACNQKGRHIHLQSGKNVISAREYAFLSE